MTVVSGEIRIEQVDSDEQLAEWVAMTNALTGSSITIADERYLRKFSSGHYVQFIARIGSDAVGVASVIDQSGAAVNAALCTVEVRVGRRGMGVGSDLLASVSAQALQWGSERLATHVAASDGPSASRFWTSRDFVEVGRHTCGSLELSLVEDVACELPDGLTITTLAERPDRIQELYVVFCEASQDVPGAPPQSFAFDSWKRGIMDAPWARMDAVFIALRDDEVVGFALLGFPPGRPAVAGHVITGVARKWRNQGIARQLTEWQIMWARRQGLTALEGETEMRNEPVLRLNDHVGYRVTSDRITLEGPLH